MKQRPKSLVFAVWTLVTIVLLDSAYTIGMPLARNDLRSTDLIEAFGGAALWLTVAYLIYRGRGWLRFVYTAVMIAGLAFIAQGDIRDPVIVAGAWLSVAPCVLWFLPASNRWFSAGSRPVGS